MIFDNYCEGDRASGFLLVLSLISNVYKPGKISNKTLAGFPTNESLERRYNVFFYLFV